jgi:hypothetical protein
MRSARLVSLLVVIIFARSATAKQATTSAPQTTISAPQAATLLQQALAALSGGKSITDVTLSGTVERIAGSDDESGTVIVKALAGTGSRIDLTLPSGPHSEIRNSSTMPAAGSWSGVDGVSHAISYHNLLTDSGWFPAFTLAGFLSAQNAVISYVGPETHDGQSVIHITASQQFPTVSGDKANTATLMQKLTQTDIYLDATTFLPAIVAFSTHPDNNALLDIPVEIHFSSYQTVNGMQIPFHVQEFFNNSLALDLSFDSAVPNSGLSASAFAVGTGL